MDAFLNPMLSDIQSAENSLRQVNPSALVANFPHGLWEAVSGLNPLALASLIVFALFLYSFIGSILTGDYSFVDRQWSIVPTVYSLTFALQPGSPDDGPARQDRPVIMAILAGLWSIRLTFNFWRRGGYSGMEDYRWAEIRSRMHPVAFQIFNLTFIAFFQPLLLMLITVPTLVARHSATPLNNLDFAAIGLFLFFLVLETTADQQQYNFQTAKYAAKAEGKTLRGDFARGFLTSGLFRYSRHPNFFAEQSIWLSFYLFSVAASGQWLNYSCLGVALLIILFQGSTKFTEMLTERRYPLYAEYQKVTSRLIPLPSRGRVPEKAD